ncbi:serine hydrolase [Idiomarina sp. PL1-037]|uniref:serine hydrolase n=1 Tax=Idiomarina sp. PL1-037 TaxID=3095365 RepID=UPI002ACC38B7|nr:serine hydrolase [Idiomarina sp. PL1-037]WQC53073.1 serine hydrolase [Idiomarina sp. PL1-037]
MKKLTKVLFLSLAASTLLACSEQASADKKDGISLEQKIRQTAEQSLDAFNIPGLAVVAVKGGEVILAEGFGVRDIESQQPVTPTTLFGIASHTKAFTAAAMATLVEQGKVEWDDKVVEHLPGFKLADPYITRELTIRDLLSHRSGLGLGAGDLMIWPNTDKTTDEVIAGLANVPIEHGFRERFDYNNLMFVTAGEVISRVTNMPYQQYVEQTFFEPMQMDESTIGFSRIDGGYDNVAVGTIEMDGELHRFPLDFLEDFSAAGATAASADDMSRWLQTLLDEGETPTGERLFTEELLHDMWQLTTPLPVSADAAEQGTYFRGYGLGWFVKDYYGVKHVSHSGGILGMLSFTTVIPEEEFAITVMSNQQAFGALTAIVQESLEEILGVPDEDWVAKESKKYHEFIQKKADFKVEAVDDPQPALALSEYVGTYKDDWYGEVVISEKGDALNIDFTHTDMLKGSLEHYNGNTFIVRWDEPLLEADAFIEFDVSQSNRVESATMQAVADFTDFSFDFHNLKLEKQ